MIFEFGSILLFVMALIAVFGYQERYGFPELLAKYWKEDVDFYVLSNEDIGLNASLVAGTNPVYSFALPYPASIDIMNETIVLYAIEFVYQADRAHSAGTNFQSLIAFMSMLNKAFTSTFTGSASDADDEALKSKFARNIFFGRKAINITATASVEGTQREANTVVDAIYFPPVPLDLATPLFIDIVNNSTSVTLTTNAVASASFTTFEQVSIVVWFRRRNLTPQEKSVKNSGMAFMRLDA